MAMSRKSRRWLLMIAAVSVILLIGSGVLVARHGSRRTVDLDVLLESSGGFAAGSTRWEYERDILKDSSVLTELSSDNAGRIWGDGSGRLGQRVYRYNSPALARVQFLRSDPAQIYCDPGECDGTRNVDLPAPSSADAYKVVCIKAEDYCSNYIYFGRFGQYLVEVRYNAGLSGRVLNDTGFAVVAAHIDGLVGVMTRG